MKTATLKTQFNEARCKTMVETHILDIKPCCPMTQNPRQGSVIEIEYRPDKLILEVASLRAYVDSFIGGRGDVRSMEGMIQQITKDCADAVKVCVRVTAFLNIDPDQRMKLDCAAYSK